jgi:predicted nucleic acid-binding protein
MLLYLDACCLNRPFDDQTQRRIKSESDAILQILQKVDSGLHQLCDSAALRAENSQNPNLERRNYVEVLLNQGTVHVTHEPTMDQRVTDLCQHGFRPMDAYHVACAEAGGCHWLVTCDDRFLKKAARAAGIIRVAVINPVSLIVEAGF